MASSPSDPRAPGKLPIRQASRKFMTFYEADPVEIEIQVSEVDKKRRISGKVSCGSLNLMSSVRVHLVRNGARTRSANGNFIGEFDFGEVAETDLTLEVEVPTGNILGRLPIAA